jgi:uncharacterized protein YqkB
MRPARLLVLLAATLLAALFVIPSAVAGTPAGASAAPTLTVSPGSGPVGTRVTVEGQGCANPGADTVRLVFQSGQSGTTGAVDFGDIAVDEQGRFRTTVTIPAELDPLQGVGGGPTQPGSYGFVTRPPTCTAAFTVTAPAPEPQLTVSPSSGPVGTRVTVEGQGCADPGAETVRLVFQSGQSGTTGAVDFGDIPVDEQGRFRTRVTIPAEMDPLQGVGGGPTQPGSYGFVTRPPICTAAFTVTGQAPGPPAGSLTVTRFSCASVTVKGSVLGVTEATAEVAVRPAEGGGSREDFVAGPVQVFPDVQGNIAPTTLRFTSTPPDGQYVAVVLVDFIERGQSAAFTLRDCGPGALPFTGSATVPSLIVGLAMVAGGLALVHKTRTS